VHFQAMMEIGLFGWDRGGNRTGAGAGPAFLSADSTTMAFKGPVHHQRSYRRPKTIFDFLHRRISHSDRGSRGICGWMARKRPRSPGYMFRNNGDLRLQKQGWGKLGMGGSGGFFKRRPALVCGFLDNDGNPRPRVMNQPERPPRVASTAIAHRQPLPAGCVAGKKGPVQHRRNRRPSSRSAAQGPRDTTVRGGWAGTRGFQSFSPWRSRAATWPSGTADGRSNYFSTSFWARSPPKQLLSADSFS